jgi:hypothetical protein
MATKDLHNNIHVVQVLYPAAVTGVKAADQAVDLSIGGVAGGSTNLAGPAESCEFVFTVGAVTGTTPTPHRSSRSRMTTRRTPPSRRRI